MELIKFIIWLTIGAVIGWFAGRTVKLEHRRTQKLLAGEDSNPEKS